MTTRYIEICPRGFVNETYFRRGSPRQIANALEVFADNTTAWARRTRASDRELRAIIRHHQRYYSHTDIEAVETITEDDVRRHRPEYIHDDGSRSLGGPALDA